MKKLRPLWVALAAVVGLAAAYYAFREPDRNEPAPPPAPAPTAQSSTLPNGMVADLVPAECGDEVAVVALFQVGSDHDPPEQSGMAHLVRRARAKVAGGERKIESGSDHTLYSVVVPGERLDAELEALAALMARGGVDQETFEAARQEVLDEIRARSGADAQSTATTLAAEAIQPSRGNGRRGGVATEVEAIDHAQADAFWRSHYTAGNTRLVVMGRIDPEVVRAKIDATFAALPAGQPPVQRPPGDATVIGTLVMGDAPTAVAWAVPAPPPSDPVYPAFLVLAARLIDDAGGPRGWSASYDPLTGSETLFVTGGVPPGEAPEPVAARIRAEATARLEKALEPADLAAARKRFDAFVSPRGPEEKPCDDLRRRAIAKARRAQLGLSDMGKALDDTTQADLTGAAAYFDSKRTTAVIAGGEIR